MKRSAFRALQDEQARLCKEYDAKVKLEAKNLEKKVLNVERNVANKIKVHMNKLQGSNAESMQSSILKHSKIGQDEKISQMKARVANIEKSYEIVK
jgi:hypothetical protein